MDKIYGRNPVSELIKSDKDIDKIYVNKELMDGSFRISLCRDTTEADIHALVDGLQKVLDWKNR